MKIGRFGPFFVFVFALLSACSNSEMPLDASSRASKSTPASNASIKPDFPPSPEPSPTATPSGKLNEAIEGSVGLVDVFDGGVCLRTLNRHLTPNSSVIVVDISEDTPQNSATARVISKLDKSCVTADSDIGDEEEIANRTSYYLLKADDDAVALNIGIGIAILDATVKIQTTNGMINADLDKDGKNEYFRSCASNEGLHFTVWSGKPLKGPRLWHRYYYLHYDTEPSCKPEDYEKTDE